MTTKENDATQVLANQLVEAFNDESNRTHQGVLVVLEDEHYKNIAAELGLDMETVNRVHGADQAYAVQLQDAFGRAVLEHQKTFRSSSTIDEYLVKTRLQCRNVDIEAHRTQVDDHEMIRTGLVETQVYDNGLLDELQSDANAKLEALYRNAMQSI